MRSIVQSCLVAASILAGSQLAVGQELGEASAGFDFANRVCAGCHAVTRGGRVSPNENAPPFDAIANTRGMSEMALRVWFQTPHPTMPNLALSPRQKDDVVAYILSLKERQ